MKRCSVCVCPTFGLTGLDAATASVEEKARRTSANTEDTSRGDLVAATITSIIAIPAITRSSAIVAASSSSA